MICWRLLLSSALKLKLHLLKAVCHNPTSVFFLSYRIELQFHVVVFARTKFIPKHLANKLVKCTDNALNLIIEIMRLADVIW